MSKDILDNQVEVKSDDLKNRKVAFCVGGGIASVEAVKNIRELRRHGAEVTVYMSAAATRFITPLSLEWSSGQPVILESSGLSDHIFEKDILVVAPATANTISKVASGLSNDVVSGLIASALGQKKLYLRKEKNKNVPIIFFPTMHESLYYNPLFEKNLNLLKNSGIVVPKLSMEENKFKIPSPESLVAEVLRAVHQQATHFKKSAKILITGGMVPSYLDQIRFIANEASGRTAFHLAREFYQMGHSPILLIHQSVFLDVKKEFPNLEVISFKGFEDYLAKVMDLASNLDLAVFTAGVSDFKAKEVLAGKRSSKDAWSLDLVPNEKVIDRVRAECPNLKTVAFKLLSEVSQDELFKAMGGLLQKGHSLVVGNILEELKAVPSQPKRYLAQTENFKEDVTIINTQTDLAKKIVEII